MRPKYREDKTTQAAGIFLSLNNGQMNYMKLIKLLYIADRKALLLWGRPITYDAYVSMKLGPALSETLDLITDEIEHKSSTYWKDFISDPDSYSVRLLKECPFDELSEAEIDLINKIFEEFGQKNEWQLSELAHHFSEWQDPKGSCIPISYRDILRAGGKTDIEIAAIEDEIDYLSFFDSLSI